MHFFFEKQLKYEFCTRARTIFRKCRTFWAIEPHMAGNKENQPKNEEKKMRAPVTVKLKPLQM